MHYRKISAFKYMLAAPVEYRLPPRLRPTKRLRFGPYLLVLVDGLVRVGTGYMWDGASGPTFDTRGTMEAALIHDVLYELLRAGCLPPDRRKDADVLFRKMLVAGGVPSWRARYFYWGVRLGGYWSARKQPTDKYEIHVA